MNLLQSVQVQCPYCWETIELTADTSEPEQDYIEDCSVCCQPMEVQMRVVEGVANITVSR